jgi:uncharacterized surface protein with fasciclin (FAS1) repeats
MLNEKILNLTNEELLEITDNYQQLLAFSPTSENFLKKLYAQTLSKGIINEHNQQFIIKAIKCGFSSSFTSDNKIIFAG